MASISGAGAKESLLVLLNNEYTKHKNWKGESFIPYKAVRALITADRVRNWSKDHSLCQKHEGECPELANIIRGIFKGNRLVFVLVVLAQLESLMEKLLTSKASDMMLFDTHFFNKVCDSAGLTAKEKQTLIDHRSKVGVVFADDAIQTVPRDAVLPFLHRNSLGKHGSSGSIYKVELPGGHLSKYSNDTVMIAEKAIRPDSDSDKQAWERQFREVRTLQRRSNHPNVIPLLAAYLLEVDESGIYVTTLHLLFPLAEMDLAEWMAQPRMPSNVEALKQDDRQAFLYRCIYGLVSGLTYLHKDVDGLITTHHDLKPRNILWIDDQLKIADFGHSHLRPVIEGSATEGASGLGTYECQPPEYWNMDGTRAQARYGRPFDVWAMGCILVELITIVIHEWQSGMINRFREERKNNATRDRKSPKSIDYRSDNSFHNNTNVVKDWMIRLGNHGKNRQLDEVLNVAGGMLALKARNRLHMWEAEMDLQEIPRKYDDLIPSPEDLCVSPPYDADPIYGSYGGIMLNFSPPNIKEYAETPLHRAAKKDNWARVVRLWALGWPLSCPDINGDTPMDIMKRSNILELRTLEKDVTAMLANARHGNIPEIKKQFEKGLTPLMVDTKGHSALHEAITSFQCDTVDFLLERNAEKQLELWDRRTVMLPLHTAASIGYTEALQRILDHESDINISKDGFSTALYYAAAGNHIDVIRLLLQKGARTVPEEHDFGKKETPLHATLQHHWNHTNDSAILELLLSAPDGHSCIELNDAWGRTPLRVAANNASDAGFATLLQHGASVHAVDPNSCNLLHAFAENGRANLLRSCIADFSLDELQGGDSPRQPYTQAREQGHREVARLLKDAIRHAEQAGRGGSGSLAFLFGKRK